MSESSYIHQAGRISHRWLRPNDVLPPSASLSAHYGYQTSRALMARYAAGGRVPSSVLRACAAHLIGRGAV